MKTAIQIFLKQTRRGTKRLVLQLALLCAAVVFFVVSLNLYANSMRNLQTVEDSYATIATVEFYGNINRQGELVDADAPNSLGLRLVGAKDYDLSPLLNLDCVTGCDLRQRCAAYIPGEQHVKLVGTESTPGVPPGVVEFFDCRDVIRFMLDSDAPVEIPLMVVADDAPSDYISIVLPIRLLGQTVTWLEYPNEITLQIPVIFEKQWPALVDDIRRLNRSDRTDAIVLQPDVEYVMMGITSGYFQWNPATETYTWYCDTVESTQNIGKMPFILNTGLYGQAGRIAYHSMGASVDIDRAPVGNPYGLQRYEDVAEDAQWNELVQCLKYSNCAFPVTLTNNIQRIPAWYKGGMYLQEGRMITKEEYASGAKVCMISAQMAEYQGWQVGDVLDMKYFEFSGYVERSDANYPLTSPWYYRGLEGFFHTGEYEIVGIFGQREVTDLGGAAEEVFYNPWNTIYVPTNSVENAPDEPVQASTLTLYLQNGSIPVFQAAVEALGLTEQKTGEYQLKFSYFDQGYDKIQSGLVEMNKNARLLLGLSAVLLAVTMILMAFLFSRQHKHSAGILRLLGGSRGQAFSAILVCAAAVAAVGGILGTILGGVLTQSVGASILGDTAESAVVALHTGASPALTALSGLGCILLFLALTAVFTATYIGKEPRQLLPESKG